MTDRDPQVPEAWSFPGALAATLLGAAVCIVFARAGINEVVAFLAFLVVFGAVLSFDHWRVNRWG